MKVSVIIPSYNHEKFITETIQSVLNQTFQDFEIIITDDGSSDNTVKEIKKIQDNRIKLFVFEENKGAYFAVENCLKHTTGEYIAILSSDDIFLPNKLEKQVKFLDENEKYAAVFGFAQIINENGNDFKDKDHFYSTIFIQENRTRYEWLRKFFYEGNCLCHPSVLIRREFYTIDQFDPRYRQLPDFDFWIKLCMKADIYILQENLIKFRLLKKEANASANTLPNNIRGQFEFSKILNLYTKIKPELYTKIFGDIYGKADKLNKQLIPFYTAIEASKIQTPAHESFAKCTLYHLMGDSNINEILNKQYDFSFNKYYTLASINTHVTELNEMVNKKDSQIVELNEMVNKKDSQIVELNEMVNKKDSQIIELNKFLRNINISLLKRFGIFDSAYYIETYSDVRTSNIYPLKHYIIFGWREGRRRISPTEQTFLRKIYQKFPILRKLKTFLWSLKEYISIRKYMPTSSVHNKLALKHLTERRFEYTENFFNQADNLNQNDTIIDIDISIVTYNSSKWIKQFLDSLLEQEYPLSHINLYFVDNGSKDDTIEKLEFAKEQYIEQFKTFMIIQQKNLGFGAGHDRAIQSSKSEFCLVTNIDLVFEESSILNAVKTLLDDVNEVYASFEFRQIPYEHPKYYDPVTLETNWSSHACIFLRRSAYEKVGGYEPKIFMYAEDVELSYRFRAYGYHLKYCPNALVHHFTYEHENQIKPLQFEGSTLGNAYSRLRYGNMTDKLAIIPLYLALFLQEERFEGSRKIILKNIIKIIKNKKYFTKFKQLNQGFHAPFREFDYEIIRDGSFYSIELPVIKPLVSIIVRTYKGRDVLLKQCLLSIINQTYSNIEIIVVEDGGETMRPITKLISSITNIKYYNQEKIGRSATGNFGLKKSKGDYCLFLDDDDLIFADHIEILARSLQDNPEASASYSLAYEVPTHMGTDKEYYYEGDFRTLGLFYQPFDYEVLTDHNYFPIQTVLFKKELFLQRGGFNEDLTYLEDWNLWLKYAYENTFIYNEKTTSIYRTPINNENKNKRDSELHEAYNIAKDSAFASIALYSTVNQN